MTNLIVTTVAALTLLGGAVTAQAASTPAPDQAGAVVQNSRAMAAADKMGPTTSIRQEIQQQLSQGGYTNVTIMPSSFLVRATDKQGNPVEMVIGPESVTEVTEMAPKTTAGSQGAMPKAATSGTTQPAP